MSLPVELYQWFNVAITCHAWNKDRTQVALSPNNHEIHIYKRTKEAGQWERTALLAEHDKTVTSIDWAPVTNQIVSCSQDRNAYVWQYEAKTMTWKPSLVILRINRAATFVRWSPLENKFAVASGARAISICYYEADNDWWVSKHIRRPLRSTVLSLSWHPNNTLIACGSSDFYARIFNARIDEVDAPWQPTPWSAQATEFGDVISEYCHDRRSSGWVHSVNFSPDGNVLVWCTHDSTVCLTDAAVNVSQITSILKLSCLPFRSIMFLDREKIIGAGYDCCPVLMSYRNQSLVFVSKLDTGAERQSKGLLTTAKAAMNMFRQMDSRAQADSGDVELDSIHQSAITCLMPYELVKSTVIKVSSSGLDGKLVVWDMNNLDVDGLIKAAKRLSVRE